MSAEVLERYTEVVDLLYRAHQDAALVLARSLSRNEEDAEGIFREAFACATNSIYTGDGGSGYFAAELDTAVRAVAAGWYGPGGGGVVPVLPVLGLSSLEAPGPLVFAGPVLDGCADGARFQGVLEALGALPVRWQEILWRADVLGEDPGLIAGRAGISPDAVVFLIRRARGGLRKVYREL